MSIFIKKGKTFRLASKEELVIHEQLPVATYNVGFDSCSGQYFLETIESFEIKHKLYGETSRNTDRILQTFLDRTSKSTGVLLTGQKGSGKTLLAKNISIVAAQHGIPTIVVNQQFSGDQFNTFIQMIAQPAMILFDEYEKVYNSTHQEKLLTLLDGVYPSQKLFILTCNDKWRVNDNMRNRPGRIYYMLDFEGLGPDFIREYCRDHLRAKEHTEKVVTISNCFRSFNFDMLQGLVEEMNRFKETPVQVLKFLNARPSFELEQIHYQVKLRDRDGKVYAGQKDSIGDWSGNPLKTEVQIHFRKKDGERGRIHTFERFNATDLSGLNNDTGAYFFKNQKGMELVLTPRKTEFEVNYDMLLTDKTMTVRNDSSGDGRAGGTSGGAFFDASSGDVWDGMDVTESDCGDY